MVKKVDTVLCPRCGKMMSYSYEDSEMLHCGNCDLYIPKGPYCYRITKTVGNTVVTRTCKYYSAPNMCLLLGIIDDILLEDQCKVCGAW